MYGPTTRPNTITNGKQIDLTAFTNRYIVIDGFIFIVADAANIANDLFAVSICSLSNSQAIHFIYYQSDADFDSDSGADSDFGLIQRHSAHNTWNYREWRTLNKHTHTHHIFIKSSTQFL